MTVQTKWKQNKYIILSFIVAYHKKEQAHAENHNPEDSYSANIPFKKHHSQPALNPYNTNLVSTSALHSF